MVWCTVTSNKRQQRITQHKPIAAHPSSNRGIIRSRIEQMAIPSRSFLLKKAHLSRENESITGKMMKDRLRRCNRRSLDNSSCYVSSARSRWLPPYGSAALLVAKPKRLTISVKIEIPTRFQPPSKEAEAETRAAEKLGRLNKNTNTGGRG